MVMMTPVANISCAVRMLNLIQRTDSPPAPLSHTETDTGVKSLSL
jgi:hypothetical protein